MSEKVFYQKKIGKATVTISKTSRKEKVEALIGFGLLALAIWYFFIR